MGVLGRVFARLRYPYMFLLFCACGAVVGFLAPYGASRLLGVLAGVAWFDFWYAVLWLGYGFYCFLRGRGF